MPIIQKRPERLQINNVECVRVVDGQVRVGGQRRLVEGGGVGLAGEPRVELNIELLTLIHFINFKIIHLKSNQANATCKD